MAKTMNMKIGSILKIVAALFVIKAIMNYHLLMALPRINYYWTLQYVGAVFILAYFISAIMAFSAAFLNKNWVFACAYVFVVFSLGMASPALPIPLALFPEDPSGPHWIYGFDLFVLLFVVFLHVRDRQQRKARADANEGT